MAGPPVAVPHKRTVQTMKEKCNDCIFLPGNQMRLAPGRVKAMLTAALKAEGHITCHKTLTWPYGAICRGYIEADKTNRCFATRMIRAGLVSEVKVTVDEGEVSEVWSELRPRTMSPRMTDVLADIAEGLTTYESGQRQGLSHFTIKTHRRRVYIFLGARNGAHAVRLGYEQGWIKLDNIKPIEKEER
jgi:DNA-binding CsgD family transcriptional regulator